MLSQVGSGDIDFGVSGGDSVISARAAGTPVESVMQFFTSYPVGLVTLADGSTQLTDPSEIKGLNIGVSQLSGSTYFGLLALLQAANLTTDDVHITTVGSNELEALSQKRVDAVMTLMSDEPAIAKNMGIQTTGLLVGNYVNLVSSGLVTSDSMIKDHPEVVQKLVAATAQAMNDALQNPDVAYLATVTRMTTLTTDQDKQTQRDILTDTQKYQQPIEGEPIGWLDPQAWTLTEYFLKSVGVLNQDVDPATCYTNQFVAPGS